MTSTPIKFALAGALALGAAVVAAPASAAPMLDPGVRPFDRPRGRDARGRSLGLWPLSLLLPPRPSLLRRLWLLRSRVPSVATATAVGIVAAFTEASGAFRFDGERQPIFFCLLQRRGQVAALLRQHCCFLRFRRRKMPVSASAPVNTAKELAEAFSRGPRHHRVMVAVLQPSALASAKLLFLAAPRLSAVVACQAPQAL